MDYSFWGECRIFGKKLIRRKPTYKNFHSPVNDLTKSCHLLAEAISSGKPFMVGKLGESELEVLRNAYALKRKEGKNKIQLIADYLRFGDKYEWTGLNTIVKDSGFFPADVNLLNHFSAIYFSSLKQVDYFMTAYGLHGWYGNKGEDYILRWLKATPEIITVASMGIPTPEHKIWSDQLAGKKVLIIHPFDQTITRNYKNREKHFPFSFLPDFDLKTIRAVQSVGFTQVPFKDWFEALDYMKSEIAKTDFDIAFLGCGAYGLPLAAYIKEMGKQAIHIGGGLQLFFGIRGNRWDSNLILQEYYNEFWTRPSDDETPDNAGLVGDGGKAYW